MTEFVRSCKLVINGTFNHVGENKVPDDDLSSLSTILLECATEAGKELAMKVGITRVSKEKYSFIPRKGKFNYQVDILFIDPSLSEEDVEDALGTGFYSMFRYYNIFLRRECGVCTKLTLEDVVVASCEHTKVKPTATQPFALPNGQVAVTAICQLCGEMTYQVLAEAGGKVKGSGGFVQITEQPKINVKVNVSPPSDEDAESGGPDLLDRLKEGVSVSRLSRNERRIVGKMVASGVLSTWMGDTGKSHYKL